MLEKLMVLLGGDVKQCTTANLPTDQDFLKVIMKDLQNSVTVIEKHSNIKTNTMYAVVH